MNKLFLIILLGLFLSLTFTSINVMAKQTNCINPQSIELCKYNKLGKCIPVHKPFKCENIGGGSLT